MNRLAGKVALVTGSGSGIGRATVKRFASEGASVVVNDIVGERAHKVVAEITEVGGQAVAAVGDVSDHEFNRTMIETAINEFGKLDVLHNNAFVAFMEPGMDFLNFDVELFDRAMAVNVLGGVFSAKHAIPYMLDQGAGSIIWTSTSSSLGGEPIAFTYGASKASVNWYTQSIAVTYGRRGIRSNAIFPGVMRTPPMLEGLLKDPEMAQAYLDLHRVPRLGEPEDIANMALFLASDESEYINGSFFEVNGGIRAGVPFVPIHEAFAQRMAAQPAV